MESIIEYFVGFVSNGSIYLNVGFKILLMWLSIPCSDVNREIPIRNLFTF